MSKLEQKNKLMKPNEPQIEESINEEVHEEKIVQFNHIDFIIPSKFYSATTKENIVMSALLPPWRGAKGIKHKICSFYC